MLTTSSTSSSRRIAWVGTIALAGAAVIGAASQVLSELAVAREWNTGRAEILFIGSSHVRAAVKPRLVDERSGIIAFAGLNIELMDLVLRKHSHRWPRLRAVVVEVDEFTLLTDRMTLKRGDLTHLTDRLDLSVWDLPRTDGFSTWARRTARSTVLGDGWAVLGPKHRLSLPQLRAHLVGRGEFFAPPEPRRSWADADSELTSELASKRVRYVQARATEAPSAAIRNVAALATLAARARQDGFDLALVSMPKHQVYRSLRPPEWDEAIRLAVEAARSSGGDVPYWDLQRAAEFSDDEFGNQDHLNAAGAALLAPELKALVNSLVSVSRARGHRMVDSARLSD